jgi:hypothetical protein
MRPWNYLGLCALAALQSWLLAAAEPLLPLGLSSLAVSLLLLFAIAALASRPCRAAPPELPPAAGPSPAAAGLRLYPHVASGMPRKTAV